MRIALAGDTMLARGVARVLGRRPPQSLVDPELAEITRAADLFVLNLECCISERGEPVPKTFNFRAPPTAVETLLHLGVDCVTLANNHALDYGIEALLDTFAHLGGFGGKTQRLASNVTYVSPMASPVLWEVPDGRGRMVQMREKQLNHLLEHKSMRGEEDAIRLTISDPDIVVRPKARAKGRGIERRVNCRIGAHSRYKGLHILVPIDYGRQENWVVTAYPSANLPKGDVLYVRIPFREP